MQSFKAEVEEIHTFLTVAPWHTDTNTHACTKQQEMKPRFFSWVLMKIKRAEVGN